MVLKRRKAPRKKKAIRKSEARDSSNKAMDSQLNFIKDLSAAMEIHTLVLS